MNTRILLRTFFGCLIACASLVLVAIWFGKQIINPVYFQTTATLFVIGLASFLSWFSLVLLSIWNILKNRN